MPEYMRGQPQSTSEKTWIMRHRVLEDSLVLAEQQSEHLMSAIGNQAILTCSGASMEMAYEGHHKSRPLVQDHLPQLRLGRHVLQQHR